MARQAHSARRWFLALALLAVGVVVAGVAVAAKYRDTGGPHLVAAPAASSVDASLLSEVAEERQRTGAAFPSAAQPKAPATIWAVGDGANGSDPSRTLARRIAAGKPQRVLYLGDVYETGTADDFRVNFDDVYGGLAPIMAPTPGNHDWPNHATGYDPYWRSITGRATPHWYALTIGGWRIVSVNSEDPKNAEQLRFLDREVAGRPGRCVIVTMHRPRQNAGSHGDETAVEPLWRRVRGRVPVVLAGHDHDLQRLKPVAGTTQYVIGAGGRERYGIDSSDPRLAYGNDDIDGALRLKLRPGDADLAIISASGKVLDRSSATCAG